MEFQYGGTTLDIMSTKLPFILVIACYLYVFTLFIMYFLVLTAVLMVWLKSGVLYSFGSSTNNCFV